MLQEFAQEVENAAKSVVNDVHTAMPGKIVSFDPQESVAVVQPKGKFLTTEGASLEYPLISDVPVAFPYCQSSGVGMVFPVKPDDDCLIVVSEVELDEWRSGAESEAPLRFDLTNAVAIPGLMSNGNESILKAVEEEAVVIEAKGVKIVVSDGTVSVKTDSVEMVVSGGNVSITGNLTVSGDITAGGDVNAGNVSLRGHTHPGVHGQTGSAS